MSTKSIDWSKAPEGATHFEAARDESEIDVFWRVKDGVALQVWRLIPWRQDPGEQVETFTYGPKGCDDFDASRAVPRPVSWFGEGLPPVGTVCEYNLGGEWVEVEVFAHRPSDANSGTDAIFDIKPSASWMYSCRPERFRPLRSPEQIAAEEREKAAKQLCVDAGSPELTAGQMAIAYRLYDAGYRKVEGGAA
ncbi:hypothetical protein G7008_03610 [Pseudomonas psychrotolerans]|uniref:hypothetical protein n=1 Tax=Pseudomonas oryzihabitans TaxID=47885 RepID=UPI0015E3A3AB|nr:hypothetical protein [Pseudomonas psychrotolerans]MBA1179582.1 hypothetical protein [Pseudomonas psychrotolerans]MBA1212185.1 hypothetical protein [Pseudomonas psychrotolerans]